MRRPEHGRFISSAQCLYRVMDFLVALTGRQTWSYALAILLISILVKLALTPLSNKQYGSMKEMQKLQPHIQELQAKHKNDKEVLGRKMMELYKEHGVNPAAGCAPMLVQLPDHVPALLHDPAVPVSVLARHVSVDRQRDFASVSCLSGHQLGPAGHSASAAVRGVDVCHAAMTITPTMDPQQAETQRMMAIMTPFMTTYFFLQYHLPSAFVLYYLTFNILSTAQQKYYMRKRLGDSPPSTDNGDGGSKVKPVLPDGSGNGQAKALPLNGNGNGAGNGSRRAGNGRTVPLAEAKNGATADAKGVIAPKKVHPKKNDGKGAAMTAETETNIIGRTGADSFADAAGTGELDARAAQESRSGETVTLAVTGPDAALLVGQHGQTLDALQYLLMLMTNKGQGTRLRITVDADGYRARRAQKLIDFANELAAEVGKTGQEAITDALNPMERRIIHTALADNPDVETYSEGDEPNRYVVIYAAPIRTAIGVDACA